MRDTAELLSLIRGKTGEDPIGNAQAVRLYDWGALVPGIHSDQMHAEELLVVIHKDGWALFWRDPEGAEPLWGREWVGGQVHAEWADLVTEVYEL